MFSNNRQELFNYWVQWLWQELSKDHFPIQISKQEKTPPSRASVHEDIQLIFNIQGGTWVNFIVKVKSETQRKSKKITLEPHKKWGTALVLGYHNQMNTEMTYCKCSWTCNLHPQFHWNIPFYPQYWITWLHNKCNPKTPLWSFSSQTEGLRKKWMNRVLSFNSVDTHFEDREQHWNIVQRQLFEHQRRGFLFFKAQILLPCWVGEGEEGKKSSHTYLKA